MGTWRTAEKIVATFIVLAANNLQADPASPDNDLSRAELFLTWKVAQLGHCHGSTKE